MSKVITGRCLCGAVTYQGRTLEADPFRCYCTDCQRATGTGHSEMMPLARDGMEIDGPLRVYEMTGGSGQPTWSSFCTTCGAPMTRRSARMSDRIYVHAASLDDPAAYAPVKNLHAQSAAPWDLPEDL